MGRWRPPPPKSSPYLTPEGAARLRAELHHLWRVERPQVTDAVREAAKNGDRSENADYQYGKRRLREIDRRVRYLQKRLAECVVVDRPPADPSRIYFGAWVTFEDEAGHQHRFRLVGADEIDPKRGYISIDSPVARRALGKRVDDEIEVRVGERTQTWVVVAVEYEPPGEGKGRP